MGHGNHWGALNPNVEKFISEVLPVILHEGKLAAEAPFIYSDETGVQRSETISELLYGEAALKYIALCATNSYSQAEVQRYLHTAYPYCDEGIVNRITISKIQQHEDMPVEGKIEGSYEGGALVSFFDPIYFKNKKYYEFGKNYNFRMAGIAYHLQLTEQDTMEIDKGPLIDIERERVLKENPNADVSKITSVTLSLRDLCYLMPDNKYIDEASFMTKIDDVESFTLSGIKLYKLKAIFKKTDDIPFTLNLYASEMILNGYEPKIGDRVEGVLWLQGYLIDTENA